MANRRNTQRTPPRQRTPVQALEQRVDTWIASAGEVIGRLDRQQQILERAFMSLAGDIEYISAVLDAEGMLAGEGDDLPEQEATEQQMAEDYPEPSDDNVGLYAEDGSIPDESPEEEAARLIAEAAALNEVDVTDAEAYYEGDR
jgi:hypothetical protein